VRLVDEARHERRLHGADRLAEGAEARAEPGEPAERGERVPPDEEPEVAREVGGVGEEEAEEGDGAGPCDREGGAEDDEEREDRPRGAAGAGRVAADAEGEGDVDERPAPDGEDPAARLGQDDARDEDAEEDDGRRDGGERRDDPLGALVGRGGGEELGEARPGGVPDEAEGEGDRELEVAGEVVRVDEGGVEAGGAVVGRDGDRDLEEGGEEDREAEEAPRGAPGEEDGGREEEGREGEDEEGDARGLPRGEGEPGGRGGAVERGEDAPGPERTVVAFDRKLGRQLVRCAVNLGTEPRRLTRAPSLFVGETLYGALEPGDVLPPFAALVVRIS